MVSKTQNAQKEKKIIIHQAAVDSRTPWRKLFILPSKISFPNRFTWIEINFCQHLVSPIWMRKRSQKFFESRRKKKTKKELHPLIQQKTPQKRLQNFFQGRLLFSLFRAHSPRFRPDIGELPAEIYVSNSYIKKTSSLIYNTGASSLAGKQQKACVVSWP